MQRLDLALRKSAVIDVDANNDVKNLKSFFEERSAQVRREKEGMVIKAALKAKKEYENE